MCVDPGEKKAILEAGGPGPRGRNQIKDVYGQAELPVMARDHKLSML
jgi:hypothetical protein